MLPGRVVQITDGDTIVVLAEGKAHWPQIREALLKGKYCPQPVKRVEIPKPGKRKEKRRLGIPCVVDRFIQQALLQVLQSRWDATFSESSFGFRPGCSAHQAIAKAQSYLRSGYGFVVDLDLEAFFDRVNHDRLMSRLAQRIGGQAGIDVDPCLSSGGHPGERAGQCADRGDAPGRSALAVLIERGSGRMGQGVGAARSPIRALRG
jgi:hypothetical protein